MKQGEFVIIKLTGDVGMVLEKINDKSFCCGGYWVRYQTKDGTLKVVKLGEFEIMARGRR